MACDMFADKPLLVRRNVCKGLRQQLRKRRREDWHCDRRKSRALLKLRGPLYGPDVPAPSLLFSRRCPHLPAMR
jgi:hypothetical protein